MKKYLQSFLLIIMYGGIIPAAFIGARLAFMVGIQSDIDAGVFAVLAMAIYIKLISLLMNIFYKPELS